MTHLPPFLFPKIATFSALGKSSQPETFSDAFQHEPFHFRHLLPVNRFHQRTLRLFQRGTLQKPIGIFIRVFIVGVLIVCLQTYIKRKKLKHKCPTFKFLPLILDGKKIFAWAEFYP